MDYTEYKKELQKTISDAVIKFQDDTNTKVRKLDVDVNNSIATSSLGKKYDLGTVVETYIILEL